MTLALEVNGKQYLFPEPEVSSYDEGGIRVDFLDGSAIYCDDVTGGGRDTCVWWRGARGGSLVGGKEGVYTRKDYIDYCCNTWLNRVECRINTADYYSTYIIKDKQND